MKIRFQIAWKFYFWFSLVGLAVGLLFDLKVDAGELRLADLVWSISGYIVEILALVCVYGFAWQKRFGNRIFWVVFFFVTLGYFSYSIYDALSGLNELSSPDYFVGLFIALVLLLLLPQFLANFLYAVRSKHLWVNAR